MFFLLSSRAVFVAQFSTDFKYNLSAKTRLVPKVSFFNAVLDIRDKWYSTSPKILALSLCTCFNNASHLT